jgi:RNA polymerase sigma-70 factor (ECF subfamily)
MTIQAQALAASASVPVPSSFDEAYREYVECVARWARHIGGPEVEVEDVVQEVFLVVSRRLTGFRGEARFSTWLFEITRRIVSNHRRRHRWRFWVDKSGMLPSPAHDPATELEHRQKVEIFYRALDHLPEKYRTVLVLYEIEGLQIQDIAELRDTTTGAVKVQLFRARERFYDRYQHLLGKGKS